MKNSKVYPTNGWNLIMLLLLALGVAFTGCSGCNENASADAEDATEETAMEAEEEETPPPAEVAAKPAEEEMQEHVTENKEVIRYNPNRATYHAPALATTAAAVEGGAEGASSKPFDVPPVYTAACKGADDPAACTHEALTVYLKKNLQLPDDLEGMEEQKEIVSFVVKPDGTVDGSNVQFVPQEHTCHKCAAEALRLVKEMPDWQPATLKGQPVEARVTLPIQFKIYE